MTSCSGVASAPACPVEPTAAEVDVATEQSFTAVLGNYTQSGDGQAATTASEDGEDASKEELPGAEVVEGPSGMALPAEVALLFATSLDSGGDWCAVEGGLFLSSTAAPVAEDASLETVEADAIALPGMVSTGTSFKIRVTQDATVAFMETASSAMPGELESGHPASGAKPQVSMHSAQAAQAAQPAQPAQAAQPAQPAQAVQPAQPAQAAQSAQSAQPAQPAQSAQSAQPAQPAAALSELVAQSEDASAVAGSAESDPDVSMGSAKQGPGAVAEPDRIGKGAVVTQVNRVAKEGVGAAASAPKVEGAMAPDALMVADAAAQPDVSEAEGAAPDGTVGEDDARMVHHAERHVQGGHRRDAGTGRDTREDGAQQREDSRALPTGGAVRSEGNAKDAGAVESSFGELVKARASAHSAQHGNHGDAANSAVPGRVETPEGAIRPHGVVPSAGVERPHGAMDSAEKWHMRMEELGKTVAGMVWRGEKNLQVTLMPEHLGRITLSCQATDAGLAVVLHAENREAQSLLARQEEAVRSLLAESGFKLTQFDVRDDGGEGRRQRADAQGESGGSPVFYGRPTGAVQAAAVKSDRVAGAGGFWGTA